MPRVTYQIYLTKPLYHSFPIPSPIVPQPEKQKRENLLGTKVLIIVIYL